MAKGYWIGHIDLIDPEGYKKYQTANEQVFRKFGARFLVRGGAFELKEGELRSRHLVIEFPDYATALACYNSPEYADIAVSREHMAEGELLIIEGYDG